MSGGDIEPLLTSKEAAIVRHRGKCESVPHNARCVLKLIEEEKAASDRQQKPDHGYFDRYIWSFVDGAPLLNSWPNGKEIPTETGVAIAMSEDLKRRGFKFVGPKICYSLMQSCGLVIDHPKVGRQLTRTQMSSGGQFLPPCCAFSRD